MPWWLPVEQSLVERGVGSIRDALYPQLGECDAIRPGDHVALAVGSRGIGCIRELTLITAAWIREQGAQPVVVPSMGSHGGATAQGQLDVLSGLGLSEDSTGLPVATSLETTIVGHLADGTPVHVDAIAAAADHVIPLARVKPHTDFRGSVESGLLKMIAIGLGNHIGAMELHKAPLGEFPRVIEAAAKLILQHVNVPFGVAVVEGARKETALVEAIPGERIAAREPELLKLAKEWLPRLPVEQLDVLVVQEIGKDIAGTGMDPNVTGRFYDPQIRSETTVNRLVVLDLTPQSHGNATGIGMADIVTERAHSKIDWRATYTNEITANLLQGARLPLVTATDKEAISIAAHTTSRRQCADTRLAWIRNTGDVERFWITTPLFNSIREEGTLTACGEPRPIVFHNASLRDEPDR